MHRALRELVVDGGLGELRGVRVGHTNHLSERLRGWRVGGGAGAGVVLDLTVHDADTVRFVTGLEPVEVTAVGFAQGLAEGTVDAVVVAGRLTGNASMLLHDAYTVPHARTTFEELFGTEGSALATDAMSQAPDGDVVLRRSGQDDIALDLGQRENLYQRGLRGFAAAVAGDGDPPCTGADAALAGRGAGRRGIAANRTRDASCLVAHGHDVRHRLSNGGCRSAETPSSAVDPKRP